MRIVGFGIYRATPKKLKDSNLLHKTYWKADAIIFEICMRIHGENMGNRRPKRPKTEVWWGFFFTYNSELMEDAASLEDAVEVADLVRVLGGNGAIRIDRGGGRLSVATASSSFPSVLEDPPCWFADGVSADAGASSIA